MQENKMIEERLESLKRSLELQRQARGQSDSKWSSGRKGSLGSHAASLLQTKAEQRKTTVTKYRVLNSDADSTPGAGHRSLDTASHNPSSEHRYQPQSAEDLDQTQSSNLLDGEFDEDGGHASFLAALNEWRGVKRYAFS
jgi:hypothetical protein